MEIRDYNGTGEWSVQAVHQRYLHYCERYSHGRARELKPLEHIEGNVRWVYPITESVADGIKAGDPACVDLGVEFIESAHKQAFGRTLHARVARALRQASLNTEREFMLREDWLSATQAFRAAIRLDPSLGKAHAGLGAALGNQELWELAVEAHTQALTLAPDDVEVLYSLGVTYG